MSRAALRLPVLIALALGTAACGHRIPGFGRPADAILLVRHTQAVPQEIRVGDNFLGIAQPGGITCFRGVPTGTLRLEARAAGGGPLTRATRITLPSEQPLLWDIDHDQVLSGRAHAALCSAAER